MQFHLLCGRRYNFLLIVLVKSQFRQLRTSAVFLEDQPVAHEVKGLVLVDWTLPL